MNKKEQAEMDALRDELRLAKALRFTEQVLPDVPPPTDFNALTKGFLFNAYFGGMSQPRVEKACSSFIYHNFGSDDKTSTQGSRSIYSTRLLALKGMRHEVEKKVAAILARIDEQIEAEGK